MTAPSEYFKCHHRIGKSASIGRKYVATPTALELPAYGVQATIKLLYRQQ